MPPAPPRTARHFDVERETPLYVATGSSKVNTAPYEPALGMPRPEAQKHSFPRGYGEAL